LLVKFFKIKFIFLSVIFLFLYSSKSYSLLSQETDLNTRDENFQYSNATYFSMSVTSTFALLTLSAIGSYQRPPEFNGFDNPEDRHITYDNYIRNITNPVMDKDNFFLNYIAHPYAGSIYYLTARNSNFSIFESFLTAVTMSTFWEYGPEGLMEYVSIQDLIITPVLGSAFGELFYQVNTRIIKNNHKLFNSKILGYTFLTLSDPMYAFLTLSPPLRKILEQSGKRSKDGNINQNPNNLMYSGWQFSKDTVKLQIRFPI